MLKIRYFIRLFVLSFLKRFISYIFIILPFILLFKTLYICLQYNDYSYLFFSQQFISNIPIIGIKLLKITYNNDLILTLDNIINNHNISGFIFAGGIGSCFGWSFFDVFIKETLNTYLEDKTKIPLTLNMNEGSDNANSKSESGKGLASGSGSASASGSNKPVESSKEGRVITDSDFESDENYDNPYHDSDSDSDHNESNISKFINTNLDEFEERAKKLTVEELAETLDTIDEMKKLYEESKVPSAKEQILILTVKETICAENIEKKLAEDNSDLDCSKDKGKGKDKEN